MPTGPALRTGDTAVCPLTDGPKPHGGGSSDGYAAGGQGGQVDGDNVVTAA